MHYLLLIHTEEAFDNALSPDELRTTMAAYMAYTQAMKEAGVYLGGERLRETAQAHTVRIIDGKSQVLNGPYAETKEQLGGYYLIDVPDLATAQSWAARCPNAAVGTMEVRPVWTM